MTGDRICPKKQMRSSVNDSSYIRTASVIHRYEKNILLKAINDHSITDIIPYFPEW